MIAAPFRGATGSTGEAPCPSCRLPIDERDVDQELWDVGHSQPVGLGHRAHALRRDVRRARSAHL